MSTHVSELLPLPGIKAMERTSAPFGNGPFSNSRMTGCSFERICAPPLIKAVSLTRVMIDVVCGDANCNTTYKKLPLLLLVLHSTNNFGCEILIKQNIATASKIQEKLAQYKLFHDLALWDSTKQV